ncbi:MAG: pilJ, partial [Ramlibacter sp.]|nr:pilJ [Ramlibacter sp.]
MSVAFSLKNLFAKRQQPEDMDPSVTQDLSLGAPDNSTRSIEAGSTQGIAAQDTDALDDDSFLEEVDEAELISVPLLGRRTTAIHQRILFVMLGAALFVLGGVAIFAVNQADKVAQQVAGTGNSLMQSQRLAKSVSQALIGSPQAFPDVRESAGVLARTVRGLQAGDAALRLAPVSSEMQPEVAAVVPKMQLAEKYAKVVMDQEKILTQVGAALRTINRQSSDLLEIAETVSSLKLQQNAPSAEISAAGQLVMLTQRIGKSANEFLTMEGVSPEAVFLLGKDLNSFKEIAQGMLDGSTELRLAPSRDEQTRERLTALLALYEQTRTQAGAILSNLQGLVAAREAQAGIIADSEELRRALENLQAKLSAQTGLGYGPLSALIIAAMFAILCAIGLAYVQLQDSRNRQQRAESQRHEAERQEQEAKRVNDANQAAILRLMNELQSVAEGDLTQEATVTEDITGAIADSVNYTVEERRQLVGAVQNTATKVAQTTAQVESTSTELLAASTEQLREIRETGQSVLDMAARINQVSGQAQESAQVARQSLRAAESGLTAVQNAIGGMNSIRDQIQETSKRIKRLGESS